MRTQRTFARALRRAVAAVALGVLPAVAQTPAATPAYPPAPASSFAAPGDRINLAVWGEPSLSGYLIVSPEGEIVLPKVGPLRVTSIPVSALRDTVRALLANYVRAPSVDVLVERRVVVNGAVYHPDVYFVDVNTTLRDLIAHAGGINENGSSKKVSILRDGRTIDFPNWQDDASTVNALQSGDQIVVGRRSWVAINLFQVASLTLVVASFLISLRR